MSRIDILESRMERIIKANRIHNYSNSLAPERKHKQYFRVLLEIRTQKNMIYRERRKDPRYAKNLKTAVDNIYSVLEMPIAPKSITPIK